MRLSLISNNANLHLPIPNDFKTARRILIIGNYGHGNLGDEILFEVLLNIFDENQVIIIPTRNKNRLFELHPNKNNIVCYQVTSPLEVLKFVMDLLLNKIDLIILGGGTIITADRGIGIDMGILLSILLHLLFKSRIYFYGIGISHNLKKAPLFKHITKIAFSYSSGIYVRDFESLNILKEDIKVTPLEKCTQMMDLALYWKPKTKSRLSNESTYSNQQLEHHIVGFALTPDILNRVPDGIIKIRDLIRLILEVDPHTLVYLFSFSPDDYYINQLILSGIQNQTLRERTVVLPLLPPSQVYNLFLKTRVIIGMRLHSILLSYLCKKPAIVLSPFSCGGEDKQERYARFFGYPIVDCKVFSVHGVLRLLLKILEYPEPTSKIELLRLLKVLRRYVYEHQQQRTFLDD